MGKHNDIEVWKDVPDTNSEYQISSYGRVRSWIKRGTRLRKKKDTPTINVTSFNTNGYPCINMSFVELGKKKTIQIHRMVALLFVENPHNYNIVLHLDDNKKNCHFSNLKWGTSLENNSDAFKKEIVVPAKGVARGKSALSEMDVRSIFKSSLTCVQLGVLYKVNPTCISDIRSGRSWNHITGLLCTRKKKPKHSPSVKFVSA